MKILFVNKSYTISFFFLSANYLYTREFCDFPRVLLFGMSNIFLYKTFLITSRRNLSTKKKKINDCYSSEFSTNYVLNVKR